MPTPIFSDWVERQKVLIVRDEEVGRGVEDKLGGAFDRRGVYEEVCVRRCTSEYRDDVVSQCLSIRSRTRSSEPFSN